MKNMRAKLRQKVSFKDENYSKVDQDNFSFKSKNQELEKKLNEMKLENSKRDNSILYEEENLRIQNETKDLIRKTKNMMENLELNKIKSLTNKNISKSISKEKANNNNNISNNNSNNLSVSFDNRMKRSFNEEMYNNETKKKADFYSSQRNYNTTNYSHKLIGNNNINNNLVSKDVYLNNSYSNLGNEIMLKNHKNISIEHMTQELLDYKKKVQKLEKELKDKNNIIKKLHEKIDHKNVEIANLNELINKENAASFKAEIATLTRKLNNKEKAFEESKKSFEKTIDEYKVQMTDLIRFNDCSTIKIKELEDQRDNLHELIKKLETDNLNLNNECRRTIELFENEKNIKENIRNENDYLKEQVKIIMQMLKDLQYLKDVHKKDANKFFDNLFNFYKE